MNNKKRSSALKCVTVLLLVLCAAVLCTACSQQIQIKIEGELPDNAVIEYTGEKVQFPLGHVEDASGRIVSYDVEYEVINLADNSSVKDSYATFDLKTGEYRLLYTYKHDGKIQQSVNFSIKDTTSPVVEFLDVPNGLFLQDITADTVNKLPLYSIEDASTAEGIELTRVLKFKGEQDADFQECSFREINNSYEISAFGTFRYELTATDTYGNETAASVQWKVKDRDWKPTELPAEGILADYSVEGYCNLVEGGDANQYYKIGNDYKDEWLAEFEGAQGVLKMDLTFNNAVGWGNNTIRLRLPKTFTQEDLEGKYLTVRIYVEGEHIKDSFLFAGNNVEFRPEDATTRAFSTGVNGLKTGQWMTFYIEAATVENIGMYPNATYNPNTTFYEGGEPADAIQLCFHREAGYFNNMVLYVDSISIAEILPDTAVTVNGKEATWTAVEGAAGYLVNLNGEETVTEQTSFALSGDKGYIRVTPLGNGVTTLNAQTVTAVYGLDAGNSLAKFDDALYADLFTDSLRFSTDAEHNGYRPNSLNCTLNDKGMTVEIGTGAWGVVTGIRFQFPKAQTKGSNTTLVMDMHVSDSKYGQIRVYDYKGKLLGNIPLDGSNTGDFHRFEIDISAYTDSLEGIQLIFGPNQTFTSVNSGVTVTFREIRLENTYYPIEVDGVSMMCAGSRVLQPGYSAKNLVQFVTFYNFGVPVDNTALNFSGTVLLEGKELKASEFQVIGYPNIDTICFNVAHNGKILTIMKDSIIYYNGIAVKVAETFNARWNGSGWTMISAIPEPPEPEYVTLKDGSTKLIGNKVELEAGYTAENVVQFLNVYDFGVPADDTPLGFEGVVKLNGETLRNPVFVGYPNLTTIALKAPHKGMVLTIMEGAVIYYGEEAAVVTKTFNAKWDGTKWIAIDKIPEPPAKEYITVNGEQKELVGRVTLQAGYTTEAVVQFLNVQDFGVPADDTALGFAGKVLLDGKEQKNINLVGYANNTTIGLKIFHSGKTLTVMKDAVIYYEDQAVMVEKTFNAKWDGTKWIAVDKIPEPPAKEYITVNGEKKELVDTVTLTAGYTLDNLIQFVNVYDFGCPADSTPIGFEGQVLLQGAEVKNPLVEGYLNSTTIGIRNIRHKGKVVTIMEGAIFYNDTQAVKVAKTFNAKWDGETWTAVDKIPEPEAPVVIENLQFTYRYGTNNLIQVNTNLPATTPLVNFTTGDNGCQIDESANIYQNVGWIGMEDVDGTIVLSFHFNSSFTAGQTYQLPKGALFGFTDGSKYPLDKDYLFRFDGTSWEIGEAEPEEPTQPPVTEPTDQKLSFQYRYGSNNLIQVNTNLPVSTPIANFLVGDNGCQIDESANRYQNVGWIGMENVSGTIVLTFHFNGSFTTGQTYVLSAGSVFGFKDGSKYELDLAYTFTFNGTDWAMATAEGTEPEPTEPEPTEPPVTEPSDQKLSFQYRYGSNNLIQVNTNLPVSTPIANFLTTDNGCQIDESANRYQNVGWIGMENVSGTIVLTFHFNGSFTAGQTYVLSAGSVFGFKDGSKYALDLDYTFTFNGTDWAMATAEGTQPEPTEPETTEPPVTEPSDQKLSFQYRYGSNNLIQVNTNLPVSTPIANFLTTDNGCQIDESANRYQNVGWIGMENVSGTIVLTFHFNGSFTAGQTYVLSAGSVFGFKDGSKYELDLSYTFTFNGTDWAMTTAEGTQPEPTEPETTQPEPTEPETTAPAQEGEISFAYRYGTDQVIQVDTNLPASVPCVNFLVGDNGCQIDESANRYQNVGWIGMTNLDGTVILSFNFNGHFLAGQTYVLPAGAVFGFTDGSTYTLDKNYTFTWDGTVWTMTAEEPEETPPEGESLSFSYRFGSKKYFQLITDLPVDMTLERFTPEDNGCEIDQSACDQQVSTIGMYKIDGQIVLTFTFANAFESGQVYVLPQGSIFGFSNGKKYILDRDYTLTFDGTAWTMS